MVSDMKFNEGKIPVMLLHTLEMGNYNYEVTDLDSLPSVHHYKKPVSYMIINNPTDSDIILKKYIKPGVYRYKDGKLTFEKASFYIADLSGEDTLIISSRYDEGSVIDRGKRILKIVKLGKTMSKGELNLKSQELVRDVKKHFNLPE